MVFRAVLPASIPNRTGLVFPHIAFSEPSTYNIFLLGMACQLCVSGIKDLGIYETEVEFHSYGGWDFMAINDKFRKVN